MYTPEMKDHIRYHEHDGRIFFTARYQFEYEVCHDEQLQISHFKSVRIMSESFQMFKVSLESSQVSKGHNLLRTV